MRAFRLLTLAVTVVVLSACARAQQPQQQAAVPIDSASAEDAALAARAEQIAREHLLIDTHIDLPYRLNSHDIEVNVAQRTRFGDFDYPRAKAGGLNVAFMSIYIPTEYQGTGEAKELADTLIARVEQIVQRHPDKFAIATSPEEVMRQEEKGLVSLAMGMENGAALEGKLSNVKYFYEQGVRYITLAHGEPNKLADSSYDEARPNGGLSAFGEKVVREMNRLGMMVDVSHITDAAIRDVLRVTDVPVVASHSGARHFTPGWERNLSDELIKAVAENGGVIMIPFGSVFLRDEYQDDAEPVHENIEQYVTGNSLNPDGRKARVYRREQRRAHPIGTVEDVADHIDYIVDLVGVEHVGLGSDFDGVFALPVGLQDVSGYPNLVEELLRRGYTEEEISNILGDNLIRVWRQVEESAAG